MSKITIDLNQLKVIADKAGEFLLDAKTESQLSKLFIEVPNQVAEYQELAKQKLMEATGGMATTIATDNLKVRLSSKKGQYSFTEEPVNDFVKEVVSKRVDADKVREYLEANGSLPEGITQAEEATTLAVKGVE